MDYHVIGLQGERENVYQTVHMFWIAYRENIGIFFFSFSLFSIQIFLDTVNIYTPFCRAIKGDSLLTLLDEIKHKLVSY